MLQFTTDLDSVNFGAVISPTTRIEQLSKLLANAETAVPVFVRFQTIEKNYVLPVIAISLANNILEVLGENGEALSIEVPSIIDIVVFKDAEGKPVFLTEFPVGGDIAADERAMVAEYDRLDAINLDRELAKEKYSKKNQNSCINDSGVNAEMFFEEGMRLKSEFQFLPAVVLFERYQKIHPEDPRVYFELAYCSYADEFTIVTPDYVLNLLDRAIALNPDYGEAIGFKGAVLSEIGSKEGLDFLHKGNSLAPKTIIIVEALYRTYDNAKNFTVAAFYLEQLIELYPIFLDYQYALATLYHDLGNIDKAILVMEKVVNELPETHFTEYLEELRQLKNDSATISYPGMNN